MPGLDEPGIPDSAGTDPEVTPPGVEPGAEPEADEPWLQQRPSVIMNLVPSANDDQ